MVDKRPQRKSSVVAFLSRLDADRISNLESLINSAKSLKLEDFDFKLWENSLWEVKSGRLLKLSAKNVNSLTLNFSYAPALDAKALEGEWADVIKAIMVLRFHRHQQSAPNQRNFIAALGYVAFEMESIVKRLFQLTPQILDIACKRLSQDYSDGVAYNMQKAIGEFAAHCDANSLCNTLLKYKYYGMKRPANTGGLGHKRLDDPETLKTEGNKIVDPNVFKIIGELYLKVPLNHKYRFYVLALSLLAMLGRRFSEVSTLPKQQLNRDDDGRAYLNYFPRKKSHGDVFTPLRKLYLPTEIVSIVEPIISELNKLCVSARKTATEMHIAKGSDLSFLLDIPDDKKLYKEDLEKLGFPSNILDKSGWIRKKGFAFDDGTKLTEQWMPLNSRFNYTTKAGLIAYCEKDFKPNSIEPIHVDQHGQCHYLKDMLLVRNVGLSSGYLARWVASQLTHSMLTTFLRNFPALADEYASSSIEVDFTSHLFRHTLNTLLDEGGLSDLLQTEWFGRSNSNDTKAYQHTSREKRALLLREDIKAGKVAGHLVDQIRNLPVSKQDAVIAARIHAVHDVGAGICVHNFTQVPCSRHLQCAADCKDYLWVKGDEGRKEELKRQYAMTVLSRKTVEERLMSSRPKKSADWMAHNDKKLKILSKQMEDYGIEPFDPIAYLEKLSNE